MRTDLLNFVFLKLLIIYSVSSVAQSAEPASATLIFSSAIVKDTGDIHLEVKIESKSDKQIIIPQYPGWGYLSNGKNTGCLLMQVQKRKKRKFIELPLHGFFDDIPREEKFDTLLQNNNRTYNYYFSEALHYQEGDYRVRVLCGTS